MIYHVLPVNDKREHEEETTCLCKPNIQVEPLSNDLIVIHNSYDGRELLERIVDEVHKKK